MAILSVRAAPTLTIPPKDAPQMTRFSGGEEGERRGFDREQQHMPPMMLYGDGTKSLSAGKKQSV